MLKSRVVTGLLSLLAAALLAACGGERGEQPPEEPHVDEQAEQTRKFAELRASEEYQVATEQITGCLAERGYVGNPYEEGMSVPDGTVLKIGVGDPPPPLTGVYLDFRVVQEECQEAAGFEAVLQKFGLTSGPQGITPERLAEINGTELARMQCMEGKGWDVPEPVTLQGMLVFNIKHDSPEKESAWRIDLALCQPKGGSSP